MGNSLKSKNKKALSSNNPVRSKGDRLGWESLSEYKPVPIKKIIGEGIVLKDIKRYSNCAKMIP
ncbi:MAG: hypothetical protein EOM31_07910 [Bacteroidia bacterium]|nr:hypothetical protein [Bacteroidia bacterium]